MPDVDILPFREEHVEAIAKLWEGEREGAGERWRRRFRWQYIENPARDGPEDIGLVMCSPEGRIVGSKLWMPQRFKVLDEERTVRVSTDTVVDPAFRGAGLKLIFEYFRRHAEPFALSTSAGERHARIWLARRGACVPGGEVRHTVALRPRRLIQSKLRSKAGAAASALFSFPGAAAWRLRFGRAWRRVGRAFRAEEVTPDDPRLAALWDRCRDDYAITAVRDRTFLSWRHGEGRTHVVLVSDVSGEPVMWAAYVTAPSAPVPIRRARVLDLFGSPRDVNRCRDGVGRLLGLLHDRGFVAADFSGLAPVWQAAVKAVGARRFVASCNFVYVSRDPRQQALAQAAPWHIVPADGDAGFWDLPDFPPATEHGGTTMDD